MGLRDDWLKRAIKQLGDAFARIGGLRRQQRFEEALEATQGLGGELLGLERTVLDALDAASAARVLGREKSEVYARMLEEDALTLEAMGDASRAGAVRSRALALRGA